MMSPASSWCRADTVIITTIITITTTATTATDKAARHRIMRQQDPFRVLFFVD
jgi:hypothetical protein